MKTFLPILSALLLPSSKADPQIQWINSPFRNELGIVSDGVVPLAPPAPVAAETCQDLGPFLSFSGMPAANNADCYWDFIKCGQSSPPNDLRSASCCQARFDGCMMFTMMNTPTAPPPVQDEPPTKPLYEPPPPTAAPTTTTTTAAPTTTTTTAAPVTTTTTVQTPAPCVQRTPDCPPSMIQNIWKFNGCVQRGEANCEEDFNACKMIMMGMAPPPTPCTPPPSNDVPTPPPSPPGQITCASDMIGMIWQFNGCVQNGGTDCEAVWAKCMEIMGNGQAPPPSTGGAQAPPASTVEEEDINIPEVQPAVEPVQPQPPSRIGGTAIAAPIAIAGVGFQQPALIGWNGYPQFAAQQPTVWPSSSTVQRQQLQVPQRHHQFISGYPYNTNGVFSNSLAYSPYVLNFGKK